jgi:uncharacterized membrane protein (DUF485 family)
MENKREDFQTLISKCMLWVLVACLLHAFQVRGLARKARYNKHGFAVLASLASFVLSQPQ